MSNIKLAFQLGVAFGMGRAWAKSRNMAMDADKWITVKPHGDVEGSGRPVLIDGETGTIKGGMGGKFTGQNIRQDWKQNNKSEQATSAQSGQNNGTNQQEGGAMKVSDDNWETAPLDSVEGVIAFANGVNYWANPAGGKGERLQNALFDLGFKSFHGDRDGKPVSVAYRNGAWRYKGIEPQIDAEPNPFLDRTLEILQELHENGSLKKGLPKKAKTDSAAKPSLTKTSNGMFATTRTYRALGIEGKGTYADPYTYKGKKVPFDLNKAKYNWDQDSGRFVFKGQTMNSGYAGRQAVNFLNDLIDEYNGHTETDGPKVGSSTKLRSMQDGHSYNPDKPLVKHFSFGRLGREVFSPNGDGVRKNYQHYESLVERAKNHFTFSNDPKHLQRDMNTYAKARNDVEEMDKKLEANPKAFKQLSQDEQNKYLRSMAICQFFEGSPEYSQVLQDYSDHRYKNGYTQPETAPWPEEMRKPRAKKTTETAKTETSAHPWMNNFGLEDHPDVQKALNRHKESSSAASRSRRKAGSEPADMDDDGYTMRQYLRNPQKSYDDLLKTVQWPKSFPEDKRKRLAELEAQTNFLQALVSGNDYERGHPVLKRYYDLLNEQRELNNELQEHFQRS